MCTKFTSMLLAAIGLVPVTGLYASGFRGGDLIVAAYDRILVMDPMTGESQVAFESPTSGSSILDVAYNSLTRSVFFLEGTSLMELIWSPSSGFTTSMVLSGLNDPSSLAVDQRGNILFDQVDFVSHDLWQLNRDSTLVQVTKSQFDSLFVPTDMELSADGRLLYVSNVPSNDLKTIDLASGEYVASLDLSWPKGIASTADGSIFVAEGGPSDPYLISVISPSGAKSTYTQQSWMEFMRTGFWGDIEYDTTTGILYAAKSFGLYVIDPNLSGRQISPVRVSGLDMVTVPESTTLALLLAPVVGIFLSRYQGRQSKFQ